jgi:glycosyltransferase involved in cell wall biosynthesis
VDDPHRSILAAAVAPAVRIAFTHSILFYGSTEGYLSDLFRRLPAHGFEVCLAAPDEPVLEPLLTHDALAGSARFPLPAGAGGWIRSYAGALRSLRPALVHHGDVDPPAMLASALVGVRRRVVTHHTPELRRDDNLRGRSLRRLAWATRPHVIFTSELDRQTALRREPIAPARSSAISLAIDLERFSPRRTDGRLRRELGLPESTPIVGTVGRLQPQKGHVHLIAAAAELRRSGRDAAFVVVGDGALRDELHRQARAAGVGDRFHLFGHRDDVPELLSDFDVFVLSSDFEGMCLAVAEALAMERPVVATDVGGVRQSVVPGETGLLVEPRDPHALARGIAELLDRPDEARRMAEAGRERVERLYALDTMVAATADLYRRLLGGAA